MRVGLLPATDLSVGKLQSVRFVSTKVYRAIGSRKITAGEFEYVIVEYDDTCPDSESITIGLIIRDGGYVPHAVWDNRVWVILSKEALSLVSIFMEVSTSDLQTAERVLNESQRRSVDDSSQPSTARRSGNCHNQ